MKCQFVIFYLTSLCPLSEEQKNTCEGFLTETEIFDSLISFENNKSPGNDGFTKEFYITFLEDIKEIFLNLLQESKRIKELCTSKIQAIIKLLEKSNKSGDLNLV